HYYLQTEAFAAGQRLRFDPGAQKIVASGFRHECVAAILKIDVLPAVEEDAKRLFAGMLFRTIEGDLHVAIDWSELPGKSAAGISGFKAAVPKERSRSVRGRRIFHHGNRLRPQSRGFTGHAFMNQRVEEKNHIAEENLLMQRH